MKRKFLAAVFAATMAVSGLVGVAPASATEPVISAGALGTEFLTDDDGVFQVVVGVTGADFRSNALLTDDFDFEGPAGVTFSAPSFGYAPRATLVSVRPGSATNGTVTIQAKGSAFVPEGVDSNVLTLVLSQGGDGVRKLVVSDGASATGPTFTGEIEIKIEGGKLTLTELGSWGQDNSAANSSIKLCDAELNSGNFGPEPTNVPSPIDALNCVPVFRTGGFGGDLIADPQPGITEFAIQDLFVMEPVGTWTKFPEFIAQDGKGDFTHFVWTSSVLSGQGMSSRSLVWSDSVLATLGSNGDGDSDSGVTVTPAPFTGPVLNTPAIGAAVAGGKLVISGSNLGGVSKIEIGGLDAQVVVLADGSIEITVPRGLAPGVYDIVINSDAGRVTVQGGLTVRAGSAAGVAGEVRPSTKLIAENRLKVWAFGAVGAGKVQIKLNGQEVAWANALSADDPKLRDGYLVRTLTLAAGKNVIEVYVDGERVSRRVATGS